LVAAHTAEHFEVGRLLFSNYAAELGVDLCFQNFNAELDHLATMYGPPSGRLILAYVGSSPVGCVGVRALASTANTCEMKRLYVRRDARGSGLGRSLAVRSIDSARELGYTRMVLDTLRSMTAAHALYEDLGFRMTDAYYPNPNQDVRYLELML
jgi:GNAT superfamily N-acetyltransferase